MPCQERTFKASPVPITTYLPIYEHLQTKDEERRLEREIRAAYMIGKATVPISMHSYRPKSQV